VGWLSRSLHAFRGGTPSPFGHFILNKESSHCHQDEQSGVSVNASLAGNHAGLCETSGLEHQVRQG
jgi:hypothetical protein